MTTDLTQQQMIDLMLFFPPTTSGASLVRDWANAQINDALFVQLAASMLGVTEREARDLIEAVTNERLV